MELDKRIDLNIGNEYLSGWDEVLAVRELIANALDETDDISITSNGETTIIENKGSEIEPKHFLNKEGIKTFKKGKIGKFGVGLKDAIAVLTIRGIDIKILTSKYLFKPEYSRKCSLIEDDTLYIKVDKNTRDYIGTCIILEKCEKRIIDEAKFHFLKYRKNANVLESTKDGQVILEGKNDSGTIYLNGMKISQEKTFIFSYNITNEDSTLKNGLSRERKEISRELFKDSLNRIIADVKSEDVLQAYYKAIIKKNDGTVSGELIYKETLIKTIGYAIERNINIVIFSTINRNTYSSLYRDLCNDNKVKIIMLVDKHYNKVREANELYCEKIFADNYIIQHREIKEEELTKEEVYVFGKVRQLLMDYAVDYLTVSQIVISDKRTIAYDKDQGKIVIPRQSLNSIRDCFLEAINSIRDACENGEGFKDYVFKNIIEAEINNKKL